MADWEVLPKEESTPPVAQPRVSVSRKPRLIAAFVVAALFFILGRQWVILPALIAEAIPGLAVFPFWLLVVGSIALWGTVKPLRKQPPRS